MRWEGNKTRKKSTQSEQNEMIPYGTDVYDENKNTCFSGEWGRVRAEGEGD